ncbi:MAG: SURF1 family protein [Gemmatimonadetes bacterium]|nr:SURF1 family protein [Gemmatimonadota bacterium]
MKSTLRGVFAALFVLAIAAVCARLGFWQVERLQERRARNAALERAMTLPPLDLRDSFARIQARPDAYIYRRVHVAGQYDAGGDLVLRGRSEAGTPGVHLATPLLIGGDTAVVINRGWVSAPDAITVDPGGFAEPGTREVEGILLAAPATTDAEPLETNTGRVRVQTFARLPLDSLRGAGPYTLLGLYVQQTGGTPPLRAWPRRVPAPELGEGPHLGYAVQWFSFAAIALIGLAVLTVRSRRSVR